MAFDNEFQRVALKAVPPLVPALLRGPHRNILGGYMLVRYILPVVRRR